MRFMQLRWIKRACVCILAGASVGSFAAEPADAQIFGGRIRNWIRGNRVERIPADEAVIIERRYVEPRIEMPGDPEPAYSSSRRYEDGDDYGSGVSERVRRERGFAIRRRPSRDYDDVEVDVRTEGRTVRSLDGRRSALRTPEDRWDGRDEFAAERRSRDLDVRRDYAEAEPLDDTAQRRVERTLRVDRRQASSVTPAEDPYEPEVSERDRSGMTSRDRVIERERRSIAAREAEERDLELGDPRRPSTEELSDERSARDRRTPRSDERVRPAAAEEPEAADMPEAVDRERPEAIDDFDMPRSQRDSDGAEAAKDVRPSTSRPASDRTEAERTTSDRRLPSPPAGPRQRPAASADDDLLPPPPDDE